MRKYELILKSNMVSHDRMDNRPIAKQMVTFLVPWHKESCEVLSQRVMWGIITKSHVRYYHKESCEVLSQSHVRYYHRVMWGIITKSHVRYYHKESCEVLSQRVMWGIIVTLCLLPSSSSSENILYFRMKSKNDTSYLSFWLFEMRIWQNINIAQFLLVTSCKVKFIFSIHIVSWS